jgi:galactonate dehydratase
MRVTGLTTYLVSPRWCFLRVDTDEGISGWGEPVVEGRAATVATAVAELSDLLVGRDPGPIEDLWQVLTKGGFYRGGAVLASAVAGIDTALWDIAGKAAGKPVHQLLGGPVRDRVRAYGWIGGDRPSEVATAAAAAVERGFGAVKMNGSAELGPIATPAATRSIVERVEAVREAIGPAHDVAIDFHGRVSPAMARRLLPLLEPSMPLFVEEPVLPEQVEALARIVASTTIPIATGERAYSRWDAKPLLDAGVAVLQPDPQHAGGISEVRRIAALAEVYGASIAPHCPLGPIALAACLQLDLAIPNLLIQETGLGIHYDDGFALTDYLVDPSVFHVVDGHLLPPAGPGLGIEVDQAAVDRAAAVGHRWRNPVWRHPDGSFAEW